MSPRWITISGDLCLTLCSGLTAASVPVPQSAIRATRAFGFNVVASRTAINHHAFALLPRWTGAAISRADRREWVASPDRHPCAPIAREQAVGGLGALTPRGIIRKVLCRIARPAI